MYTIEKLQSALDALNIERAQISCEGWYLQDCWLVQVKPGGSARTNRKYWQVRSRQPMFDGKTLKHLRADEVEDYTAAINRGRRLKQIDCQIEKLQQRLLALTTTTQSKVVFTDVDEQERLVKKVLAQSQKLRDLLRQSGIRNQWLRERAQSQESGVGRRSCSLYTTVRPRVVAGSCQRKQRTGIASKFWLNLTMYSALKII